MTKAIDFIAEDAGRVRSQNGLAGVVAAVIVALSVGLALATRPDFEDIDGFYLIQSTLLGALLFVFVWSFLAAKLSPRHKGLLWKVAVGVGLVVSLFHEDLHPFSTQASLVRFWRDAAGCFAKGVFTGLVSGAVLTFAVFRLLPVPDRRWQLGIAAAASFAGLVMLNLHCPSAVASHIVFGHWAHGILVTGLISYWQGALFRHKLRGILGQKAMESGAVDSLED